ncbi:MAG: hypothetical protein WAV05_08665 [Anaerolineales bacterium]
MKYIDPTGHDYCHSSHADPEECAVIDKNGDGKTDFFVELTHNLNFCYNGACYDGALMQDLYWDYVRTQGWWNDFGKKFFTVKDFLALILFYEMGGQADN